jgi:hypothetical protein
MSSPSQTPQRSPAGYSTDQPFGPLANFGLPNPFFYHVVEDDFDSLTTADGLFSQQTATGTSAALANAAGIDGGAWLFTTGTAANNATTIATNQAGFILPPQLYTGTGLTSQVYPSKKVFFGARVNVTNVAALSLIVGLTNHQATPTVAGITDGLYLQITSATVANLIAVTGGVVQFTVPIPAAVLALYYANTNWIDIGFEMDRQQNVWAHFGYPLYGWVPPSAWTGTNNVSAQPTAKARVAAFESVYNGAIQNPWTPTTVALSPTVMAYSTGAASSTMYLDFCIAAKER